MYFVHPQIKFNIGNLVNLLLCFLKRRDREIQGKIEQMFPGKRVVFTDMGRSAFRLIVEELGLEGTAMLVPAYICDIFLPLFREYNIRPVFVDIDKETFNIKAEEILRLLRSAHQNDGRGERGEEIKSILVCHTYGLPADLNRILEVARKYNLKVIEDCAHSFGTKYGLAGAGAFVGNFGEAALFSLYKLFPTLRGGLAVLTTNLCDRTDLLSGTDGKMNLPKTKFSARDFVSLLNCFSWCSFLFKKYAGKVAEKHLRKEKVPRAATINRVSLNIFAWQFKRLDEILKKRKELGLFFQKELKKLGFEVQSPGGSKSCGRRILNQFTFLSALVPKNINRDEFVIALRKKRVFATRIWHTPIVLNKEAQKEYGVDPGQFPKAVEVAKRIVNFPLQGFYSEKDIKKMVVCLREVINY